MQPIQRMLLWLCLALLCHPGYSQSDTPEYFTVSVNVYDNTAQINLVVNPTYFFGYEFKASIAGHTTYLQKSRIYYQFNGTLALNAFPEDSLTLDVTMSPLPGTSPEITKTISTTFFNYKTVDLQQANLSPNGVARPAFPFKLDITGGSPPFVINLAYGHSKRSFKSSGHTDTLLDFSEYEGQTVPVNVRYKGSDSVSFTAGTILVYVQSSPNLYTYQAVNMPVVDVNYHKILSGKSGSNDVYDLTTHTSKRLSDSTNLYDLYNYTGVANLLKKLTPAGMVYNGANKRGGAADSYFPYDAANYYLEVLAWNFNTNQYHRVDSAVQNSIAGGSYTAWNSLYTTDCYVNHEDSSIRYAFRDAGAPETIAADGTVVASKSTGGKDPLLTRCYFNGTQTIGYGFQSATSGIHDPVWYLRSISGAFTDSLMRFNSDGTTTFIDSVVAPFNNSIAFLSHNNFAAYVKPSGDTAAIWLKKPDNSRVQLAGNAALLAMNSKGDIIYVKDSSFYLADHTGTQTKWLAHQLGNYLYPADEFFTLPIEHIYTADSLFYLSIDNTVFSIEPPASSTISAFTAVNQGSGNLLQWKLSSQQNITTFGVERSGNQKDFSLLGTVAAQANAATPVAYSFTDPQPLSGINYYRLHITGTNGYETYSDTVSVNRPTPAPKFVAYIWPNPVYGSTMQLTVTAAGDGYLSLQIVALDGKVLSTQMLSVTKGSVHKQVDVSKLRKGLYFAYLTNGKEKFAVPFIKL